MRDPLDTLLMVVPQVKFATLHSPGVPASKCSERGCTVHTSDWRAMPGSPENLHRVTAEPTVTLRELFTRRFRTGALCSGYVITRDGAPIARVPRVAKEALAWLRREGLDVVCTCLIADVDTPGHLAWTPETREAFERTWALSKSLQTCAAYLSARGYRVLQPLLAPIPVDEAELRLHAWLEQLVSEGVWTTALECKDWGHLMRAPHHRKGDGTNYIAPWVSLERVRCIEAPPPGPARRRPVRSSRKPADGGATVLPLFTDKVPDGWGPVADALGRAIGGEVKGDWRKCYLALAGALCERGCPLDGVPAVIGRVRRAYPGWEEVLANRVEIAQSTVTLYARGAPVAAYGTLRRGWPAVADALDAATVSAVVASVYARLAGPAPVHVTAEEAVARIRQELEVAVGVNLIAGPPGLGKTRAVVDRARHLPVISERARPGTRMALGTPHHDLALQVLANLPDRAARLFGPLAHRTRGEPTCIHWEAAMPLADGAQSIEWEFCQGRGRAPCERAETCVARAGYEGPENANLVIGPHELADELDAAAGVAGVLVIDEPEGVVVSEVISLDELDTARRFLDAFVVRYAVAIAPALAALDAWTRTLGPDDDALHALPDVVRASVPSISEELLFAAGLDPTAPDLAEQVLAAARGAILEEARSKAPPIQWGQMHIARRSPGRARELGAASRVLNLLWRGLVESPPHSARIDTRRGARALVLTGIDPRIVSALRRQGPTVLLGADVALHRPALEKVLGYNPRLTDLRVGDGAPVTRTIYATRSATRSRWCPDGVPAWEGGVLQALRVGLAWAAEEASTRVLAVISWAVLVAGLAHALEPGAAAPRELWKKCRRTPAELDVGRELLAPVLATWPGRIVFGYYGHTRGLDYMREADALLTLGDPRPNIGQISDQALYLGLDPGGRAEDLAEAELEQAHGRLRTIHRTRPGRLCHVGALVNPSWAGLRVDVREMPSGRPRTLEALAPTELRRVRDLLALSQAEFAARLGIGVGALKHYEAGRAPIPATVGTAVRALDRIGSETPYQKVTLEVGF